ncbi:MAG TPA: peroxiredoxin-like family protein [Streptosporangiaceae bacterium]|jgi:peroxiredoxin
MPQEKTPPSRDPNPTVGDGVSPDAKSTGGKDVRQGAKLMAEDDVCPDAKSADGDGVLRGAKSTVGDDVRRGAKLTAEDDVSHGAKSADGGGVRRSARSTGDDGVRQGAKLTSGGGRRGARLIGGGGKRRGARFAVGDRVEARELTAVGGATVPVPDPSALVHLQFRRFAGCPICNLHLRSITARHDEITAAGIHEVVVFHSPAESLRPFVADLPFPVIADPSKSLYREFGVESSRRALLDPRAWPAIIRGSLRTIAAVRRGEEPPPPMPPNGGRLGLPADLLITPEGHVHAIMYGTHADDQWPVDTLLAHAATAHRAPRTHDA